MPGWDAVYDRWNEKWVVSEYSRDSGQYYWRTDAEAVVARKNNPPMRGAPLHFDAAEDVWPGSFVRWGESAG